MLVSIVTHRLNLRVIDIILGPNIRQAKSGVISFSVVGGGGVKKKVAQIVLKHALVPKFLKSDVFWVVFFFWGGGGCQKTKVALTGMKRVLVLEFLNFDEIFFSEKLPTP